MMFPTTDVEKGESATVRRNGETFARSDSDTELEQGPARGRFGRLIDLGGELIDLVGESLVGTLSPRLFRKRTAAPEDPCAQRIEELVRDPDQIARILNDENIILVIEGQAKTGKSTQQAYLAERLGLFPIASGLLYRASALLMMEKFAADIKLDGSRIENYVKAVVGRLRSVEEELLLREVQCANFKFEFKPSPSGEYGVRLLAGKRDITDIIQSSIYSSVANEYTKDLLDVRAFLSNLQRNIAREHHGIIAEGRGQTEVWNHYLRDANYPDQKPIVAYFWLKADPRVRAEREVVASWGAREDHPFPKDWDREVEMRERSNFLRDKLDAPRNVPAAGAIPINSSFHERKLDTHLEFLRKIAAFIAKREVQQRAIHPEINFG